MLRSLLLEDIERLYRFVTRRPPLPLARPVILVTKSGTSIKGLLRAESRSAVEILRPQIAPPGHLEFPQEIQGSVIVRVAEVDYAQLLPT